MNFFLYFCGSNCCACMYVHIRTCSDKSANAAIDQIKTKGYAQSLRDYVGDVILVGINYDPRTKHHTCLIERGDGSIVEGGKSATGQVTGQVQKLLLTLKNATMKRDELMSVMGMNSRWYFYEGYLNPAINAGYVAKTLPDKPNSSKQRYYLTPKGIELLKQLTNE